MLEVLGASSLLFGAGLLPLFFYKGKEHSDHPYFNFVLSFALSILLGDVFFHLLPEVWQIEATKSEWELLYLLPSASTTVLIGIVLFFTLDRLLGDVVGYLTICANTIDNFLHGLAIAIAFNVSASAGWLTTTGILLHELPHEVDPHELRVRVLDIFLGVVLTFCAVVGVPGNMVALRYFTTCAVKKKKIHVTTYVYMAIAAVDIFASILQLPIMVVLFGARKPYLFNNFVFCVFWANVFEFLQRSSIFLAMLLSVTRTIPIVVPLYKMRKLWILIGFLIYSLIILLEPVVAMWDKIDYTYVYSLSDPNCFQLAAEGVARDLQYSLEALNILVASIITFVSFVVTIVKLCSAPQMSSNTKGGKSASRFRQASITVATFTALFLVCNLPMFLLVFLFLVTEFKYFGSFFMTYYPWMIAKVVFVVLNGALNPILYFFRMKEFNTWVKSAGKVTPSVRTSSVVSPDSRMS